MNYKLVFYILGKVMIFMALFLLLPCIVAVIYHEKSGIYFFIASVISVLLGFLMSRKRPDNKNFFAREGFVVVALSWILMSIVGSVPFWASGEIPNPIDALFEMVSGFTTTGASIVPVVEELSKCMLFWRSFSHWIGGMGVIVFIMALLPMAGANNMHLLRAESSGTNVGKLVPKMKETAGMLYIIYLAMTLIMLMILAISGMPLFENICITVGTAGTGGFGLVSDSIASYTATQQWIITIFMFLFGVNFSFYYLLILKKIRQAFKLEEVRWYIAVYLGAVVLIVINVINTMGSVMGSTADTIRHAAFQVSSLMTTTGYSTLDYEIWPEFSKGILLLVMFTGGCAGSTAGGIKISRFIIAAKGMAKNVKITKMDEKTLSDDTIKIVNTYFLVYFAIYVVSLLVVSLDKFGFETNFTAVAATLNNIGPGLGAAGPTESFADFSIASKIVFIIDMLIGRLEIFPILLLFMPSTWKNK